MGKFLEAVRREHLVKSPQQMGFKLSAWTAAFKSLQETDPRDGELHAAGCWFAQEFQRVRAITKDGIRLFKWSSSSDRLLTFVGYSIREWKILCQRLTEQVTKAERPGYFPSELSEVKVQSPFFDSVDPEGAIEVLVDGLRFPLSFRHEDIPSQIVLGKGTVKDIEAFKRLAFTGQYYHALEQYWLHFVWNDYRLTSEDARIIIKPDNSELARRQAISEFRRNSLNTEAVQRAALSWKFHLADSAKRTYLEHRKVFSVFKRHGSFRVKAVEAARFQDRPSAFPALQLMLTPEHATPLLQRKVSEFCGLTPAQILEAYDLLSQVPDQVLKYLPADLGVEKPEELLRWAPTFSRSELAKAFEQALAVSHAQAAWLLSLMTFPREVRKQLWFQPFIDVGSDLLALIAPAAHGIQFARLVDWVLAQLPDLQSELGPLFEEFLRHKLTQAVSESSLRGVTSVLKKGIRFRVAHTEEQIDLAFVLGHKLFVCELKASLFPTEPLQHYDYRADLDHAATQASRKAEFVRENVAAFASQSGLRLFGSESEVVSPLIVSSSPLFAGWSWNGIPVCDRWILCRFFDAGELGMMGYQNDDGELVPTATRKFYSSIEEAVRVVDQYFMHAPQVQIFEQFTNAKLHLLPAFSRDEVPKFVEIWQVALPHEMLRQQIRERMLASQ